jgi:hypothetical protein
MRTFATACITLASFMLASGGLHADPSPAPGPGTGVVAGQVFVRSTKEALPYANVIVLGTRLSATGDATGRFVRADVPVGSYILGVLVRGFEPLHQAIEVRAGETTFVRAEAVPSRGLAMVKYGTALRESVGVDAAGAGESLVCRIEPFCPRIWPEELPRFHVSITNRSSRSVDLVLPLDGSDRGRSPHVTFDFQGPAGGAPTSYGARIDDSMSSMSLEDFVSLRPGKRLDLFGSRGYVPSQWQFERPGQYVVQFEYSTVEDNLRQWLGDWQPESLGEQWRSHFRRVARVDLHAECTFDVQQR